MNYCVRFFAFLLLSLILGGAAESGPKGESEKPDPHGGIFAQKCTKCHGLELVEEAHETRTNAEMREILERHKDKEGSEITKRDLKALLKLY